jgi:hypothetical protein
VADLYTHLDKEAFEGGAKRDLLKVAETELLFAPPGLVQHFIHDTTKCFMKETNK